MKKKVYVIRESLNNGNTYYYGKNSAVCERNGLLLGKWKIEYIYFHDLFTSHREASEKLKEIRHLIVRGYSGSRIIEVIGVNIEVDLDMLFDSVLSLIKEIKEMLGIPNDIYFQ